MTLIDPRKRTQSTTRITTSVRIFMEMLGPARVNDMNESDAFQAWRQLVMC